MNVGHDGVCRLIPHESDSHCYSNSHHSTSRFSEPQCVSPPRADDEGELTTKASRRLQSAAVYFPFERSQWNDDDDDDDGWL